jgi:hypothetical protein
MCPIDRFVASTRGERIFFSGGRYCEAASTFPALSRHSACHRETGGEGRAPARKEGGCVYNSVSAACSPHVHRMFAACPPRDHRVINAWSAHVRCHGPRAMPERPHSNVSAGARVWNTPSHPPLFSLTPRGVAFLCVTRFKAPRNTPVEQRDFMRPGLRKPLASRLFGYQSTSERTVEPSGTSDPKDPNGRDFTTVGIWRF